LLVATYTVAYANPYEGRNASVRRLKGDEPVGEASERFRVDAFATADDADHASEIKPDHIVI
jgi:hypothetical protein